MSSVDDSRLFRRATSLCKFDICVLDRYFAEYQPPNAASTTRPTANLGNCCMLASSLSNQFNHTGMMDHIVHSWERPVIRNWLGRSCDRLRRRLMAGEFQHGIYPYLAAASMQAVSARHTGLDSVTIRAINPV